jgi:anti-sigma28 factor (negative regulator of flagellin synthesis)
MNLMTGKQITGTAGIELAVVGGMAFARTKRVEAADAVAAEELTGRMIVQATTECDVRVELVAALRAKIEAGTYRVASADIAESLMGAMRT